MKIYVGKGCVEDADMVARLALVSGWGYLSPDFRGLEESHSGRGQGVGSGGHSVHVTISPSQQPTRCGEEGLRRHT